MPYSNVRTDPAVVSCVLVRQQPPPRPEEFISSSSEGGNTLWSLLTSCWMNQAENRATVNHVRDTVSKLGHWHSRLMEIIILQMNEIIEGGFKIFGLEPAYGPAVSNLMVSSSCHLGIGGLNARTPVGRRGYIQAARSRLPGHYQPSQSWIFQPLPYIDRWLW